jgi:hypothetical protein
MYTGLTKKSAIIRRALQSLIHLEAGRRLAELGGTSRIWRIFHAAARGTMKIPNNLRLQIFPMQRYFISR